jgi:dihydrolipoamide dehydrogenase
MREFQTIVIGAGSGGMTVAIGMAALGRPVALVEAHHVGGDCTNVGCVPSKTLIHLADEPMPISNEVLAEVQRKRDSLRDKETREVSEMEHLTFIQGRARFRDAHTLIVTLNGGGEELIRAEHIVIATGAGPRTLDVPGLPEDRTLTNNNVFDLVHAPRHLVIVGSGVIAMEMAFAFHKLGSRVTIVTRSSRVMAQGIPEASEALAAALEDRGIALHYQSLPQSYDPAAERLQITAAGANHSIDGVDYVLFASGRKRNIDKLDLERAGVKYDLQNGIAIDSYGQTNVRGIYAIGDVTPTSRFTHSANAQGRRVVQRIAFPWLPARAPEPHYPSATFSDPEVAQVGLSSNELAERYHPNLIRRIRVDLATQTDRGYTDGVKHGFIIVDTMRLTGKILAVTIVGPRASEMISLFTLALSANLSMFKLYRLVYPYPTFSSGIQRVADTFMRSTMLNLKRELQAYLSYRWRRPQPQPRNRARSLELSNATGARSS